MKRSSKPKSTVRRGPGRPPKAASNSVVSSKGTWVRYMSPTHPGYRALVSPRQLQAFGPPKDPWGDKMRPAQGSAPRVIPAH